MRLKSWDSKPKSFFAIKPSRLSIGITVLILLTGCSWNGASQPDYSIRDLIFRQSVLYSLGNDYVSRGFVNAYCFGYGGGQESGQPCVWIIPDFQVSNSDGSAICYKVPYIPEVNYGSLSSQLSEEGRRLRFPINDGRWEVKICGKFVKGYLVSRADAFRPGDWIFETKDFVSSEIEKQLKTQGYPL